MNRVVRTLTINLLLLLVACSLTFGAFEVFLHLFLPQKLYRFPQDLFRSDDDLVFALTPDFRGTFSQPEYLTHIRINSLGLRGPDLRSKPTGSLRVLGIGDSFVSAFNMEEEDTFLAVAEKRLGATSGDRSIEIVNAGTPNYGTWHELRLLKRLVPVVKPDGVLLCVYVGNDLENNSAPREAVVRDGFLLARVRHPGILPDALQIWLQRNSMAYAFLWNGWNEIRPWFGRSRVDPLSDFKALVSLSQGEVTESGYTLSASLLREFSAQTKAGGCFLLVVLIPAELQVYPSHFEEILKREGLDASSFDLDLPDRRWAELASQLSIPTVDLLPIFRSHTGGRPLYMKLDGHLTKEGNEIAGEAISTALTKLLANWGGSSR